MSTRATGITLEDYDKHFSSKANEALSAAEKLGRSWGVVDQKQDVQDLKRVADGVTRQVQVLLLGSQNLENRKAYEEAFRYASALNEGKEVRVFDSESTFFFFRWTHKLVNKFSDTIRYIDQKALESAHKVLRQRFAPQSKEQKIEVQPGVFDKIYKMGKTTWESAAKVLDVVKTAVVTTGETLSGTVKLNSSVSPMRIF